MVSFADRGGELPGVVRSIEGDLVVVDFNHPLAGKTLIFDVSILRSSRSARCYTCVTASARRSKSTVQRRPLGRRSPPISPAEPSARRMKAYVCGHRGFTLIELLVALAIMAIISAVAVPIYTEYSIRTQRTNAEKDLMLCAQSMERLASADLHLCGAYRGRRHRGRDGEHLHPNDHGLCDRGHRGECEHVHDSRDATANAGHERTACSRSTRTGATRWDRNNDGDFGDANETQWAH